jgi:peroxiredoxin Q/BCP
MKIGDKLPDLTLPASGGQEIRLRDLKGHNTVLYFYPKDNTPGCTQEGQDFRDLYKKFRAANTEVIGISKDSVKSHDSFIAKFGFPFALISDPDQKACDAFGVFIEKSMYGKKYMGIDRSTYLFDDKGVLRREWRGVKVKGHAEEVLEAAKAL